MRLSEIKGRFEEIMLAGPAGLDAPDPAFAAIFETGDIPLAERLKVYRGNIVGNVGDGLAAVFPLIEKLTGRDFLINMVRRFILENPPQGGCLTYYCRGFDAFIAGFEPAKGLPYLPDMARLEIAVQEAYYASDDLPMMPQDLASVAPDDLPALRVRLRDSVRLVKSAYPLDAIRDFCLAEKNSTATLDISRGGVFLMIHRPALDVLIATLEESEYEFLTLLPEKPLGEAVEKVLEKYPDFDFAKILQRHMGSGIFLQESLSLNPSP